MVKITRSPIETIQRRLHILEYGGDKMPRITGIFGAAPDIVNAIEEIKKQGYHDRDLAVMNAGWNAGAEAYADQYMGGEFNGLENNAYNDYVQQQEPGSSSVTLDVPTQQMDDMVETMRMSGAVDVIVDGSKGPVNRA
jgi:hypothetical protein